MKRSLLIVVVLILTISLYLTVGAERAGAQGPAGAGASTAAQGSSSSHSSHSFNPIKWIKKDKGSKNSPDSNGSRSDVEKRLTPKLQAQGILPAKSNATDVCAPFTSLNECLGALHASHNLGLQFNCLRANVTGVHTNVDLSSCKGSIGDKAQSLNKAIHEMSPGADAKGATKNAEQQAKDDLRDLGA
ncbi:MAG: hypothetical protein DMG56_22225 [Acidobacteria bacterium]|nr:MAG: hypothetical protein DMG53_28590 [Acidobacteriota bacterium]PYU44098.1 MAG: hypothetical protein DMG54_10330 [Acidobacteriota bacterium]PYU57544.1 MAG: hypothetical protein DMG56_22225 [Acidobacteriota bacterium]PYU59642.1 MAG: hypothetical protein DMG55_13230 [Acidobacteriota bacterium]PYU70125.1 MAG: hypothetical protein DMG52_26705 [Acidobacteriota bacterium]